MQVKETREKVLEEFDEFQQIKLIQEILQKDNSFVFTKVFEMFVNEGIKDRLEYWLYDDFEEFIKSHHNNKCIDDYIYDIAFSGDSSEKETLNDSINYYRSQNII